MYWLVILVVIIIAIVGYIYSNKSCDITCDGDTCPLPKYKPRDDNLE